MQKALENGAATTYVYDVANEMTALAPPGTRPSAQNMRRVPLGRTAQAQGNTMTVAYDAFHRPVTRTVNGQTRHMVWDGWQLAEERAADNALVARYIHGQGPDEIISRTDAIGATLYYHHDGLGNTLALTDSTGQVVERYSYDAFGKAYIFDAAFNPLPASLQNNRFLFTGREWIAELNHYDYRNRVYSAELGRFLQTDPIRFKAGDLNLYRYCGNDPVNWVDPTGRFFQAGSVHQGQEIHDGLNEAEEEAEERSKSEREMIEGASDAMKGMIVSTVPGPSEMPWWLWKAIKKVICELWQDTDPGEK
jgi:RHS repeat-associated protein